jgi:hypothetical protein
MARGHNIPVGDSGLTVHAGFSAQTFGGEGGFWRTVVTANATFGAIAGGASLGLGVKAISFPAGDIIARAPKLSLALQHTEDNVTSDTPDLGIGTTVASGAVAVLGGTAAFENLHTGQTMNDCDGTVENSFVATELLIPAANSHDVFVNIADGWAADGEAALGLTGTFVVLWHKVA